MFSVTLKLFFRENWDKGQVFIENYSNIFKILLLLDVLLHMNTGIFKRGTVVLHRKDILIVYMKRVFIFDILSLFAVFLPISLSEGEHDLPALLQNPRNVLKLLFFLKISQVKKVFEVIEETLFYDETYDALISLCSLFLQVLFMAHCISCAWNLSAWVEMQKGNSSWHQKTLYDDKFRLGEYTSWAKEYLFAFYWSLTTMITVGYGDISPKGNFEVIIASLSMLFGCGFFAYAINQIGFILDKLNQKQKNLRFKYIV
jgi:hypothetical protein